MTATSQAFQFDWVQDLTNCHSLDADQGWILDMMSRYGREIVSMLWRILGNEQDVFDAYQTTFVHLVNLGVNDCPRNQKAYVFRSASNTAISMLRSRASEKRRIAAISAGESSQSPTFELDQNELLEQLRYFIGQLPEHLREVIVLRDLAEMPYRRIAKMLGITSGSARVYRCKAMQLLAVWMSDREER